MAKYRKKPVVIEAFQITSSNWVGDDGQWPDWLQEACDNGTVTPKMSGVIISTLEGDMLASIGDYVIQGVNGELYPCKPDIFEKTYERVD